MERSDVSSLLTSLASSANTALALLPFIVLFKGAFILGLYLKDKVGHLLPSQIYTEALPYSTSFASLMYNTRDHNNIHDLVQPQNIDYNNHQLKAPSPAFSSYPRQRRRLEGELEVAVSDMDMVAVAAGTRPYSIRKQTNKTDTPTTYQKLIKDFQRDKKSDQASGFWESFIKEMKR